MTFEASLTPPLNGVARVRLAGDLDLLTADRLEEVVREAEALAVATIVLDLRELSFIDSSGLRCIIQAHTRARAAGRRLALVPGNEFIQRVFATMELDRLLDFDPAAAPPA